MSADPVPSTNPEMAKPLPMPLYDFQKPEHGTGAVLNLKPGPDLVRSPPHYKRAGALETIDLIDMTVDGYSDPRLAYYIGNALKYLSRAPHKGNMQQDLEKAAWYLTRAINRAASLR